MKLHRTSNTRSPKNSDASASPANGHPFPGVDRKRGGESGGSDEPARGQQRSPAANRATGRCGTLASAGLALLALGQLATPTLAQSSTSFEEYHKLDFSAGTPPLSHDAQLTGVVWALARVGLLCAGIEAKLVNQIVANNVLAQEIASKVKGQAGGANASATAEGKYQFYSATNYWMEITAKGAASASSDRCIGNKNRAATALSRAKSKFRVRMKHAGTTTMGPFVGSFGFAAAWVNKQNLGGTFTVSRTRILSDPVVVSLFDDSSNALLGQWETMRVDSKIRGNGQTEMYQEFAHPGGNVQKVKNTARDMELFIEVGSTIIDPADHGVVDIAVENGIVTRRVLTGRFSGVAGIPLLGAPGDSWTAAIYLGGIDYSLPYPGSMPTRVEVEMSGAAEGAPEGDVIGQWCDLTSEFDRGHAGADISVVPTGETAIGFSCLHGSQALVEVKTAPFDALLSHLVVPYIIPGAPLVPASSSADPFTPDLPTAPAAVYVRISDGNPALGGTVLYGGFGAPQLFEVEGTDTYRVTPSNKLDNSAYVGRAIIDLESAPVIPSGTALWIEVTMIPPLAFSDVLIPPSPYADATYDTAHGHDISTGAVTQLLEPTSNRPVCLPMQLYALENVAQIYCTAKTTSIGCTPAITWSGIPSATAGSGFTVSGTNFINNKSCLLFYGVNGQAANPFQGGLLCVKASVKRTPGTMTGGNPPPNDCSGSPSLDMNLFAVGGLGGNPSPALLLPGTVVDCQWWGRDPGFPAPNNSQLSDALEYTIGN